MSNYGRALIIMPENAWVGAELASTSISEAWFEKSRLARKCIQRIRELNGVEGQGNDDRFLAPAVRAHGSSVL